jgi:hypothetical protein
MQDEKNLSAQKIAMPRVNSGRRRLLAALSLLGLPSVVNAQQWPSCGGTAYAKLKPFSATLRDKVTIHVHPSGLSRTWGSDAHGCGRWCIRATGSSYIRYPFYVTHPKTGKVYTVYVEQFYSHTEEPDNVTRREGRSGYDARMIWPPALKALAPEKEDDLILHTGGAKDVNLKGWPDTLDFRSVFALLWQSPSSMRLVQYYRNNHSIVQKQFQVEVPIKAERGDADRAFALVSPQVAKWRGIMEKTPCDNNGSLGTPMEHGNCYLTTAAVGAVGLADDCWELQTLRHFRDTVLRQSERGQRLIRHYYRYAPALVADISRQADARNIWLKAWGFGILPAALCARLGFNALATTLYRKMTLALLRKARNATRTRLYKPCKNHPLPRMGEGKSCCRQTAFSGEPDLAFSMRLPQ